jgi:opacity protein-like surface antigen
MKRILLAGLVLAGLSSSALAGWTGCGVTGIAGVAAVKNEATLTDGSDAIKVDGLGSAGSMFGIGVGCDYQVERMVFGAFADHVWHQNNEFAVSYNGFDLIKLAIERQWTIGARVGVLATPATLIYGLAGYTQVKTGGIELPVFSESLALSTFKGLVVGGGIETELMKAVHLSLEYRYSRLDTQRIGDEYGGLSLSPDIHAVRVGVSYRFNFAGAPAPAK